MNDMAAECARGSSRSKQMAPS
jgi:hypothetical protein